MSGRGLVATGAVLWVCIAGLSFLLPLGAARSGAEDPSGAEIRTGDILVLSDYCGEMPVQRERESL